MNTANLNRALSEEKIPSTNDLKMPNLNDPLFNKRIGELLETSLIGSIFFTCIPGNATTTKTSWMWPFKESRESGKWCDYKSWGAVLGQWNVTCPVYALDAY
jgi:hypothetical protein